MIFGKKRKRKRKIRIITAGNKYKLNIFQYDRKINQKRTTELQQVKMNLDSTQSLITVNNKKK